MNPDKFFKSWSSMAQFLQGMLAVVLSAMVATGFIGPVLQYSQLEALVIFLCALEMLSRGRWIYAKLHARRKTVSADQ